MSDDLTRQITGIIARVQKLGPDAVTIDKTFEELNIDSLDGVNIIFALEDEFSISIPDEAGRSIRTVREMVEGVSRLLAEKDASAAGS
jgi:acyl carrier protein